MWYSLETIQKSDKNILTARASVPAESPWFDGHFPGDPTLPGIGQLAMVADVLACLFEKKYVVRGVHRVKFRKRISPGDMLRITAVQKKNNSYSFRMTTDRDELVSSGIMTMTQPD